MKGTARCTLVFCEYYAPLLDGKLIFVHAADGAGEVFGEVLKGSAGGYAALRIAGCGVVFPAADVANVLFHNNNR